MENTHGVGIGVLFYYLIFSIRLRTWYKWRQRGK